MKIDNKPLFIPYKDYRNPNGARMLFRKYYRLLKKEGADYFIYLHRGGWQKVNLTEEQKLEVDQLMEEGNT